MRYLAPLALLALACTTGLAAPEGAETFDPPAEYAEWHAAASECAGVSADFDRIRWHAVPGRWEADGERPRTRVEWSPPHDVYVSENWTGFAPTVLHGMLHDLTQSGEHRADLDRCSTVYILDL